MHEECCVHSEVEAMAAGTHDGDTASAKLRQQLTTMLRCAGRLSCSGAVPCSDEAMALLRRLILKQGN